MKRYFSNIINKKENKRRGGERERGRPIPDCHLDPDRLGSITSSDALEVSGTRPAIWYPSPSTEMLAQASDDLRRTDKIMKSPLIYRKPF